MVDTGAVVDMEVLDTGAVVDMEVLDTGAMVVAFEVYSSD